MIPLKKSDAKSLSQNPVHSSGSSHPPPVRVICFLIAPAKSAILELESEMPLLLLTGEYNLVKGLKKSFLFS